MAKTDVHHPWFVPLYDRLSRWEDAAGYAEIRRRNLADLAGRVVEVGAGNGRNFPHYPEAVTEVVAVEPEPGFRRLAGRAAADLDVPVRVVAGDAEHLPVEDASADVVLFSLVLCSVPDQDAALQEARRVLRPGGIVRLVEHVIAEDPLTRVVQRLVDSSGVWPRIAAGCHTSRDTVAAIRRAGFSIVELRRRRQPNIPLIPFAPGVTGTAMVA